ncbi:MAG: NAD-dependent epimerase/dehydratase family protein [Acidobacteria bacterium]|nr:NAD-dependent epimerase/dehydratase family protein [Acidobacteriota bacterium]
MTQSLPSKVREHRYLVTGAAGFIGSHLCRALAQLDGAEVRAVDNEMFGRWGSTGETGNIQAIDADIRGLDATDWARDLDGIDTVFHLAAQKLNNATSSDDLLATNLVATNRLFEAAVSAGVRRIVFASSLYAHGRTSAPALREDDRAEPPTLYGVTKLAGEGMLRTLQARNGIETVSLRLFFVYGPRQYVGLGYPSVIVRNFERLLGGEQPQINGTGQQRLDYVYIADVVEAFLRAAHGDFTGVCNIGSGTAISVNELTAAMCRVSGADDDAKSAPADWTDGTFRAADTSRASKVLGWTASTALDEGLSEVWDWLRTRD